MSAKQPIKDFSHLLSDSFASTLSDFIQLSILDWLFHAASASTLGQSPLDMENQTESLQLCQISTKANTKPRLPQQETRANFNERIPNIQRCEFQITKEFDIVIFVLNHSRNLMEKSYRWQQPKQKLVHQQPHKHFRATKPAFVD